MRSEDIRVEVGAFLRRHRGAARLTQAELSARANVPLSRLRRLEAGAVGDRRYASTMLDVAQALGLPPTAIAAYTAGVVLARTRTVAA